MLTAGLITPWHETIGRNYPTIIITVVCAFLCLNLFRFTTQRTETIIRKLINRYRIIGNLLCVIA